MRLLSVWHSPIFIAGERTNHFWLIFSFMVHTCLPFNATSFLYHRLYFIAHVNGNLCKESIKIEIFYSFFFFHSEHKKEILFGICLHLNGCALWNSLFHPTWLNCLLSFLLLWMLFFKFDKRMIRFRWLLLPVWKMADLPSSFCVDAICINWHAHTHKDTKVNRVEMKLINYGKNAYDYYFVIEWRACTRVASEKKPVSKCSAIRVISFVKWVPVCMSHWQENGFTSLWDWLERSAKRMSAFFPALEKLPLSKGERRTNEHGFRYTKVMFMRLIPSHTHAEDKMHMEKRA